MPVGCVRCRKAIQAGITHLGDTADPPARALCAACYRFIRNLEPGKTDPMRDKAGQ